MKAGNLGWVVAASLFAVAATAGFQSGIKIGIVDGAKVFNDSDYVKGQLDNLRALGASRQQMLDFADANKTFTNEQATKYHDLSLKDPATFTAADKAELDTIKKSVEAASNRLGVLQQKQNPSDAENIELQQLSNEIKATTALLQRWRQAAQDEFDTAREKVKKDGTDRVRETIKQVGSGGAYTIVFSADIAPYGANDLTDATLKAMNSKK